MKQVLVTGGAGFIGSHLCERMFRKRLGFWGMLLLWISRQGLGGLWRGFEKRRVLREWIRSDFTLVSGRSRKRRAGF